MSRTVLTAALALAVAAPAAADSVSDAAKRHFAASQSGNDAIVFNGGDGFINDRARDILAELRAAEGGNQAEVAAGAAVSTRGTQNPRAAAILDELVAAQGENPAAATGNADATPNEAALPAQLLRAGERG